jgi:hypothetical protein
MGRLIPAGTGYRFYRDVEFVAEGEVEREEEVDFTLPS